MTFHGQERFRARRTPAHSDQARATAADDARRARRARGAITTTMATATSRTRALGGHGAADRAGDSVGAHRLPHRRADAVRRLLRRRPSTCCRAQQRARRDGAGVPRAGCSSALHGFARRAVLARCWPASFTRLAVLPEAAVAGRCGGAARFGWLYTLLVNKYYFDWFNENVLAPLARGIGFGLWKGGDQALIDGALVNGSARTRRLVRQRRAARAERLSLLLRVLDDDRPGGAARLVPGARLAATERVTRMHGSPVDPDLAADRRGHRSCCCSASAASAPARWLALLASHRDADPVAAAARATSTPAPRPSSSSRTLPWIPRFNAYYALGVDGISLPLILLTAFMTIPVVIAAWTVIEARAGAVLRRLPDHGRPDDRRVLAPPTRCCSTSSGKRC